jgi:hypothetical protein
VHCVVADIETTSGSWAAGTAAGVIIAIPDGDDWDGDWTTGFFDASVAGANAANANVILKQRDVEYLDDATSQTSYGVVARQYIDKRITHPTTLLNYAQRIITQYKDPPYQYSVDVINLAEVDGFDYSFESLGLDTRVRVIDDLLNVDVNTSIVSMSINLLNPEEISIELSTIKNDFSDLFGDILNLQDISNSVATQIGAGQVTVLGTFTVIDWASAGQTTIDGGQITANTITTTQLNFTPVDSTNVVASINASTEGIVISGTKIQIDGTIGSGDALDSGNYVAATSGWKINGAGDAEFNNVTVRGNLAACTITAGQTLDITGTGVVRAIGNSARMSLYFASTDTYPLLDLGVLSGQPNIVVRSSGASSTKALLINDNRVQLFSTASGQILLAGGDTIYVTDSSGNESIVLAGVSGDFICKSISPASGNTQISVNCDISMASHNITCNRATLGSGILYLGDSSHCIFKSGSDLYWWNGSTNTKLN